MEFSPLLAHFSLQATEQDLGVEWITSEGDFKDVSGALGKRTGSGRMPLPRVVYMLFQRTYVPDAAAAARSRIGTACPTSATPKKTSGAFVPGSIPQ